jgi:phosphate ABC transporter phosphate-binding protein
MRNEYAVSAGNKGDRVGLFKGEASKAKVVKVAVCKSCDSSIAMEMSVRIGCGIRLPFLLLIVLFSVVLLQKSARAQGVGGLQSIHTVYVGPMGVGGTAQAMRARLIARLKKSGGIRVVDDAKAADAVLHGDAVIWQTGSISMNPRSNSAVVRNYQGYLSAELSDPSNRALWSYLVTPSRFRMTDIVDDLANQLSDRLVEAMKSGIAGSSAAPIGKHGAGVSLRVAGSTFPAPLYQLWFRSFGQEADGFPISYDAIGSVDGLAQLNAGKIDIAASDIPSEAGGSAQMEVLHVPSVIGGVVPIYNLPGESQGLNLTSEVLADIFSGKIRRWNDQRIREWNKGANLPDAEISVVHRSDGSGTTYVWTSYLALASPDWKARVGASVDWPVGVGEAGNEGVAQQVAKTPDSIAYVELTFAIQHQITYAAVRNPAGRFIRADIASLAAAAGSHAHTGSDDLRFSVLNMPAKDAYPLTTFTWFLVPKANSDPQKRAAMAGFLRWMLTAGQKQCSSLGYAPLPAEVVREELVAVDALK